MRLSNWFRAKGNGIGPGLHCWGTKQHYRHSSWPRFRQARGRDDLSSSWMGVETLCVALETLVTIHWGCWILWLYWRAPWHEVPRIPIDALAMMPLTAEDRERIRQRRE